MAGKKTGEERFPDEPKGFTDEDKSLEPVNMTSLVGHRVNPNIIPDSFDEAIRLLTEQGEGVVEYEGSPWHVVDKKHLVGVPFIIMGWGFTEGDRGMFVSLLALTKTEVPDTNGNRVTRVVINDGGTGIRAQWEALALTGKAKPGTLVNGGLRVSEYTYHNPLTDKDEPASTFYLA